MSRYTEIQELLKNVQENIDHIEGAYDEAKRDEEKTADFNVKVKNTLENLRSALDYVANDIADFYNHRGKYVYFPYGKNENDFKSSFGKSFPGLKKSSPVIYTCLEYFQPHVSGDDLICHMCILTNENKHNNLSKYVRKNSVTSETKIDDLIVMGEGASVSFKDSTYRGKVIGRNGVAEISGGMKARDVKEIMQCVNKVEKKYAWVEFHISGINIDVLDLLKRSHVICSNVVSKVYSIIQI